MSGSPPAPSPCPDPGTLARAVSEGLEADLRAHLAGCPACATEWRAQSELLALGRELPPERPTLERREDLRAALLVTVRAQRMAAPRRHRARALAISLAAATAAAAAALLLVPGRQDRRQTAPALPPPASGPEHRRAAIVTAGPDARFQRLAGLPHEIVRLEAGTIHIDVEPARRGETFRVITTDRVVEVRGTVFETTAGSDGRLLAVRVRRGRVAVRAAAATAQRDDVVLDAGREWTTPERAVIARPRPLTPSVAARPDAPPFARRIPERRPPASAPRDPAERAFTEGMDLLLSQESAQAARAFARAASLAPRSPLAEEFWYWRGVALAQSGVTTEARAVFEQFLARFPGSARAGEASVMAGWLLLEEGETDGAAARFRAGVDDRSARVRSSARGGLQAIARTRGKN